MVAFHMKMKIALSIMLLLPLVRGLPGISLSCFLLGNRGCQVKCSVKCLLLGCVTENSYCDGWSHCECNETYNMGYTQLTNQDFEILQLEELWNKIFEDNEASAKVLRRIKNHEDAEKLVVKLLRDPYVTGEDIIAILGQEYPHWKWVAHLRSWQHGLKTKYMDAGKPIQYTDLDANLEDLLHLINTVPADETDTSRYRIRVKNFLRKITDVSDLEQILHLVMLAGNQSLLRLVKSCLRSLGYGFEEDGDSPEGKKAILKTILIGIDEANEDEKLEIAVTNKLLPKKKSASKNGGGKKVPVIAETTAAAAAAAAAATAAIEEDIFMTQKTPSTTTATGSDQVGHFSESSATYYVPSPAYSNTVYAGYGNTMTYGDGGAERNAGGSTLYYMVVDENGNVIQASGMPKKPISFPKYSTTWID